MKFTTRGGGIAIGGAILFALVHVGLELSAESRKHARSLGLDVRDQTLEEADGVYGTVVLADVLEHLEEPIDALAAALRVSARGGTLLVSVPNAGHLSLVRDLLLGRFDPAPSGLCDAGHLRWFSRDFLHEAILEAGWSAPRIEREQGAPAPDPAPLLELAAAWPDADRESLGTYQWIATAANPR